MNLQAVAPVLVLVGGAMTVLVADLLFAARAGRETRAGTLLAGMASLALVVAMLVAARAFGDGSVLHVHDGHPLLRSDPFSAGGTVVLALAALFACWLSNGYLRERALPYGEYYALLLLSTAGGVLLVSSVDLVATFLGLELLVLPLVPLVAFDRARAEGDEAGLKFFLSGAFASAMFLYGLALVIGGTGHTGYAGLASSLADGGVLARAGLGLILAGVGLRMALVPFHAWLPDLHEGAPTSVTAFVAAPVLLAVVAALLRFSAVTFAPDEAAFDLLGVVAGATMVIGALMTLVQDDVRRSLAYAMMCQVGMLLVGVVTATPAARSAVLFQGAALVFATLGVFAGLASLAHRGEEARRFDDFAGLARTRPALCLVLAVLLLSLAGFPGTGGFLGKWQILAAALSEGRIGLALLVAGASVILLHAYLQLPLASLRPPTPSSVHRERTDFLELGVLAGCLVLVLALGLVPDQAPWPEAIEWSRAAAAAMVE